MGMIDVGNLMNDLLVGGTANYNAVIKLIRNNFSSTSQNISQNVNYNALQEELINNLSCTYTSLIREIISKYPTCPPLQATDPGYTSIEDLLKCINILEIQLSIIGSINLTLTPVRPKQGMISIEFEFTNPNVIDLRARNKKLQSGDTEKFNAILKKLCDSANSINTARIPEINKITATIEKDKGKGGLTDLVEVSVQAINHTYKIEYDWDESCIECRLICVPIDLWYDHLSEIQLAVGKCIYEVCMSTSLSDIKLKNGAEPFKAVPNNKLYVDLSGFQDNNGDDCSPLQCHVNIDNTVLTSPIQVLLAYDNIMGQQTEADIDKSIKINSGLLDEREVEQVCTLTLTPTTKTVALAVNSATREFPKVKNPLILEILNGTVYSVSNIFKILTEFGQELKTDLNTQIKKKERPHYLALNTEHGFVPNPQPAGYIGPYFECRRELMPLTAQDFTNTTSEVLNGIPLPNLEVYPGTPPSMTTESMLNDITEAIVKQSGINLPTNWKSF